MRMRLFFDLFVFLLIFIFCGLIVVYNDINGLSLVILDINIFWLFMLVVFVGFLLSEISGIFLLINLLLSGLFLFSEIIYFAYFAWSARLDTNAAVFVCIITMLLSCAIFIKQASRYKIKESMVSFEKVMFRNARKTRIGISQFRISFPVKKTTKKPNFMTTFSWWNSSIVKKIRSNIRMVIILILVGGAMSLRVEGIVSNTPAAVLKQNFVFSIYALLFFIYLIPGCAYIFSVVRVWLKLEKAEKRRIVIQPCSEKQ